MPQSPTGGRTPIWPSNQVWERARQFNNDLNTLRNRVSTACSNAERARASGSREEQLPRSHGRISPVREGDPELRELLANQHMDDSESGQLLRGLVGDVESVQSTMRTHGDLLQSLSHLCSERRSRAQFLQQQCRELSAQIEEMREMVVQSEETLEELHSLETEFPLFGEFEVYNDLPWITEIPRPNAEDLVRSQVGVMRADGMHRKVCCICLDTPAQGDSICQLSCTHTFHTDCLIEWCSRKAECPLCKAPITRDFSRKFTPPTAAERGAAASPISVARNPRRPGSRPTPLSRAPSTPRVRHLSRSASFQTPRVRQTSDLTESLTVRAGPVSPSRPEGSLRRSYSERHSRNRTLPEVRSPISRQQVQNRASLSSSLNLAGSGSRRQRPPAIEPRPQTSQPRRFRRKAPRAHARRNILSVQAVGIPRSGPSD